MQIDAAKQKEKKKKNFKKFMHGLIDFRHVPGDRFLNDVLNL